MLSTQNNAFVENLDIENLYDITGAIKIVENRLSSIVEECDDFIKVLLRKFLLSGKKIRPKLVLLSGLCFSAMNDEMINSAVVAEVIHTASLIHDDIIDKSDYRRNMPTVNSLLGNHAAVLAGDFLFAKAFEILSKNKLYKQMEYVVTAIQELCAGEMLQARDLFNIKVSEDHYFERISKKTASLLSACCKAGAQSSNASVDEIKKMGEYGIFIGYAFQIIDDLLDVMGKKEMIGKPLAQDIEQGNLTLPFIYLLQNPRIKDKYMTKLKDKTITKDIKLELINDLEQSGIITEVYQKATYFVQKAKEALDGIPDSVYKTMLMRLSDEVLYRTF
ncbi:heptaprenyl diphosphate synthase [Caldanaerobius fijiensis DSM 17918]|uniref:Heptaprenyl diphosphate synthase n=1 Tax=Caldanaerobius fijiensis DSM 17918 TaxID=1121256 RepID=A0A1M4T8E9_9THEO|nr:polyprenyl synthetase family protein [Caldanaerobius fijiensis]SHE40766.1 heptaprenyl diphosphate synthase [Caldanaerobius fijiensis DSM 17918]